MEQKDLIDIMLKIKAGAYSFETEGAHIATRELWGRA